MSIWKYLLAGGVGFGVAKLISGTKKQKSAPSNESNVDSDNWKEQIQDSIDKDGLLYTFTDYSDWKEVDDKAFQTALTKYKKDLKAFQNVIEGLPANQKEYVDGIIEREGFDYAFEGYSDFDTFFDYSRGKKAIEKKFINPKFHSARKQYLKSYNGLLKIINS